MDKKFFLNIGKICSKLNTHLDTKLFLTIRRLGIGRHLPTRRGTRAGHCHRISSPAAPDLAYQPSPPLSSPLSACISTLQSIVNNQQSTINNQQLTDEPSVNKGENLSLLWTFRLCFYYGMCAVV